MTNFGEPASQASKCPSRKGSGPPWTKLMTGARFTCAPSSDSAEKRPFAGKVSRTRRSSSRNPMIFIFVLPCQAHALGQPWLQSSQIHSLEVVNPPQASVTLLPRLSCVDSAGSTRAWRGALAVGPSSAKQREGRTDRVSGSPREPWRRADSSQSWSVAPVGSSQRPHPGPESRRGSSWYEVSG